MSLVHLPPANIRHSKSRMQVPESHNASNVQTLLIAGNSAFKFGSSPTYTLGTGTGALATRPIDRGELIHAEQPLVIQQVDQIRSAHSIFASLCVHPTALQEAYLSLPNAFPNNSNANEGTNVDALVGIFNSNCLPLAPAAPCPLPSPHPTAGSEQAHGVFLTLSKFNTSCRPNAALSWDENRHMMAVYGIEPIPLGEEITICYGQPLFAMCAERRGYLRRVKGFWCVCRCCALQGEEERASDRRRAELCRLFKAVPFLGHDASAGLRAATQALQTLNAEGLNLYQDSFSYEAYQFCMLLRGATSTNSIMTMSNSTSEAYAYLQHAKHWLERAYQWKVIVSGKESEGALFFAQIFTQFPDKLT